MRWQRNGEYAIQTGVWTIAKSLVGGQPRYLLYRCNDICGRHETAEAAKAAASRITAMEQDRCTLVAYGQELLP